MYKLKRIFLVGFMHCRELISLTEGCELARNDFLWKELISCDKNGFMKPKLARESRYLGRNIGQII